MSAVPERPAGAGRYALELARWLGKHYGSRLHLVARRGDAKRWAEIAPGAEVHALVPEKRPLRLIWEQARLPGHLAHVGAQVHLGPHYTLPERTSVPRVATIHDMFFYDNPEWHERSKVYVFRRAIRVAIRVATEIVTVSTHTENRLRARFGDVPATTIPLAVDHDRFNVEGADADAAALTEIGVARPFIAFVGTIEPRKNLPGLLRSFDAVAPDHPGLALVIAGRTGWKSQGFDETLARMQHSERVLQLGWVSDSNLRALLRSANAVAYPSFAEGFGLPALEALACGAALVTTRGSAMAEVTEDCAVLVDAHDDKEISAALRKVLGGGSDVERMRAAGPSIAASYTWERTANSHIEVLERAAHSKRSGLAR